MNEKLIFKEQWVPTIESSTKISDISFERFYNTNTNKNGEKTNLELLIELGGNFDKMISNCGVRELKNNELIRKHFNRVFRGNLETEYSYKSIFFKSGGLLNVFNPIIKESEDDFLNELKLKHDDSKAISIWINSESEFFSGLTPKLVWVGAGDSEVELLDIFMKKLYKIASGKDFTSQGDCTGFALLNLRGWEYMKLKEFNNQTPRDIIIKERQENFIKKIALLKKYRIKNDFEDLF